MGYDSIIENDIQHIYDNLKEKLSAIEGTTWLICGGGGFIGAYFLDLLNYCNKNLFQKPCKIICMDNFITGVPDRIKHLDGNENIVMKKADVSKFLDIDEAVDYIVHAASIASPTYYRLYPIQTIETNVLGLMNLAKLAMQKKVKSMLFFSTSEIYGNPAPEYIPTEESYNGNVSCTGPRACYDESKRLGETLCVNYYQQYSLPIKVARPFNVYGPGLRIDDKRVIPDFFNDAINKGKIDILSDGSPTRSFCYISDAITGFMSAILSEHNGEAFNIGNDEIEISMKDLAKLIAKTVGNTEVTYSDSEDNNYLVDNPQRRCPNLSKARKYLDYSPAVDLETGLSRLYKWYKPEIQGGCENEQSI